MPATKIINVSKSDNFEEVFDSFKNTDAEDVILIFPKGSRFVKQERYFEAIKEEAGSSGKSVSIMSTDPTVIKFASKYGFDVLEKRAPHTQSLNVGTSPAEPEIPAPVLENDYSVFATPAISSPENEFADDEPEAVLTAAADKNEQEEPGAGRARGAMAEGRVIKDILPVRQDRNLKIKEEK